MKKQLHVSTYILGLSLLITPVYVSALNDTASNKVPTRAGMPTETPVRAQGTGTPANNPANTNVATGTNATSTNAQGKSKGDEHKSAVALVVQKLLSVADRDGGIGAEVRLVAQEQASTSEKVKADMDEITNENPLKRFFFGTNYKNTGELRSTVVTTKNHIERLRNTLEKTTNTTTQAEISAQIMELEKVASSTEAFIEANENKFSLFGWLNKFLSR